MNCLQIRAKQLEKCKIAGKNRQANPERTETPLILEYVRMYMEGEEDRRLDIPGDTK